MRHATSLHLKKSHFDAPSSNQCWLRGGWGGGNVSLKNICFLFLCLNTLRRGGGGEDVTKL